MAILPMLHSELEPIHLLKETHLVYDYLTQEFNIADKPVWSVFLGELKLKIASSQMPEAIPFWDTSGVGISSITVHSRTTRRLPSGAMVTLG